jgi:uncharacterized spore protein YtfJ
MVTRHSGGVDGVDVALIDTEATLDMGEGIEFGFASGPFGPGEADDGDEGGGSLVDGAQVKGTAVLVILERDGLEEEYGLVLVHAGPLDKGDLHVLIKDFMVMIVELD